MTVELAGVELHATPADEWHRLACNDRMGEMGEIFLPLITFERNDAQKKHNAT